MGSSLHGVSSVMDMDLPGSFAADLHFGSSGVVRGAVQCVPCLPCCQTLVAQTKRTAWLIVASVGNVQKSAFQNSQPGARLSYVGGHGRGAQASEAKALQAADATFEPTA